MTKFVDDNFKKSTKRLIIRFYQESDFDSWKKCFTEMSPPKNYWDWKLSDKKLFSKSRFKQKLEIHKKERESDYIYYFALFEKKSGNLIGVSIIMDIIRGNFQTASLGVQLNNNFWGRGYGRESILALFNIAFKTLKLHRIESLINPENTLSIKMVENLGMRKEGISKNRIKRGNKWGDMIIYAYTVEDLADSVKLKKNGEHNFSGAKLFELINTPAKK